MRAIVPIVFACACGRTPEPSLESFGLTDSPRDHELVQKAIESANDVLGAGSRHFRTGWGPTRAGTVPTYAVTGDGLGALEIMSTYDECLCVIVQTGALHAWLVANQGQSDALLKVEPDDLLAYMLLHEMGHIAAGIHGSWDAPPAGQQPNLVATREKEAEIAADRFAAAAVKAAQSSSPSHAITAGMISVAITSMSWNLQAHRAIDDFGATELRRPSSFWDKGLTHPNLEWRILVIDDLLEDNPHTHQLLVDFETRRKTGYHLLERPSPP